MDKSKIKKTIKVLLILLLIVFILFVILIGVLCYLFSQTELGGKVTPLTGDIVLLKEDINVGDIVPIVLVVPEELDELHKEMWDCYYINEEGEEEMCYEYLTDNSEFEHLFTKQEIEEMFKNSPMDIYKDDKAIISTYSPRTTIFIPEKSGTYLINVCGYYKTTSPRGITCVEVTVHE